MELLAIVVGTVIAWIVIKHARYFIVGGLLLYASWWAFYSHPHPPHPFWRVDASRETWTYYYTDDHGFDQGLGWIFQTNDGKWLATWYAGKLLNDKARYPTRQAAAQALEDWYGAPDAKTQAAR